MPTVELTVKVPVKIKKKANIFVSSCPVLDVYSQGATEAEARKNIIEAVKLFLITCIEIGTLDSVLKQCGFKPIKKHVSVPKNGDFVSVPIPFSVAGICAESCHA